MKPLSIILRSCIAETTFAYISEKSNARCLHQKDDK